MTAKEDGVERLRRWTEEHRGVPPAFGRMRARLDRVEPGTTLVRLPLDRELLLPGGRSTGAVTTMLADFGLASSVISSLPDLSGVATISLTVDHLDVPPTTGALVAECTASPYDDGRPQHARGVISDDGGRTVAHVSGWLIATAAEPAGVQRVGLVEEPPADDVVALLQVPYAATFALQARDALGNAIGSLHGGSVALACSVAAQAAVDEMRPMTTSLAFLRPTPRDGSVTVAAAVLRQGRRTAAVDVRVTDPEDRLLVSARVVAAAQ